MEWWKERTSIQSLCLSSEDSPGMVAILRKASNAMVMRWGRHPDFKTTLPPDATAGEAEFA
jgi:hypothetical protein